MRYDRFGEDDFADLDTLFERENLEDDAWQKYCNAEPPLPDELDAETAATAALYAEISGCEIGMKEDLDRLGEIPAL